MYLPMGDLTAGTDFNATKYPGIAKPSTLETLAIFRALQAQLNRVAQVKGLSKIAVDGDIGPATVTLFKKAQTAAQVEAAKETIEGPAREFVQYSNSTAAIIAAAADDSSVTVKNYADSLGAPASVPGKLVTSPTILVSGTGVETKISGAGANLAGSFGQLGTTEKVAIVGAVVAGGFLVFGGDMFKKRKRR